MLCCSFLILIYVLLQVLETYLQQLFNPEVLGVAGHRVKPLPGCKLAIPSSTHRQDYVQVRAVRQITLLRSGLRA